MPFEDLEQEPVSRFLCDELINLVQGIAEVFLTDFITILVIWFVVLFEDLLNRDFKSFLWLRLLERVEHIGHHVANNRYFNSLVALLLKLKRKQTIQLKTSPNKNLRLTSLLEMCFYRLSIVFCSSGWSSSPVCSIFWITVI